MNADHASNAGRPALSIEAVDKITGKAMGRPEQRRLRHGRFGGHRHAGARGKKLPSTRCPRTRRATPSKCRSSCVICWRRASSAARRTAASTKRRPRSCWSTTTRPKPIAAKRRCASSRWAPSRTRKIPKKRLKKLVFANDVAGQIRVGRAVAHARVQRASPGRDRRRHREHRPGHALGGFNWELGPFEAWDAIGVPESVSAHEARGQRRARVDREPCWPAGRTSFYARWSRGCDVLRRKIPRRRPAVPSDPSQIRLAALKSEPTRVVKKNHGASLVDLGRRRAVRRVSHQGSTRSTTT